MRCKTQGSESLVFQSSQQSLMIQNKCLKSQPSYKPMFHKPSRSEDFQFKPLPFSIISPNSIKETEPQLELSSISLNYSSVHELSLMLEQEIQNNNILTSQLLEQQSPINLNEYKYNLNQRQQQIVNSKIESSSSRRSRQTSQLKEQFSSNRNLLVSVEMINSQVQGLLPKDKEKEVCKLRLSFQQDEYKLHDNTLLQLRMYEDFITAVTRELAQDSQKENALGKAQLDSLLSSLKVQLSSEKDSQRFIECVKDLISSCAPHNYFPNNDPNLKQVWKYLKSMLGECVQMKNKNVKSEQLIKRVEEILGVQNEIEIIPKLFALRQERQSFHQKFLS